jgi:predicted aconitase with swiveling domain
MGSRHELRDSVGQASGAGDDVTIIEGKPVMPGEAEGVALVSDEPLSFWGGYDWKTGEIIDRRHPLSGQIAAGKILCVPFTRGSSTTTAVLLESIRAGTAPAAIITTESDFFFALASVVADEMYQKPLVLVALAEQNFQRLKSGDSLRIKRDGSVEMSNLSS